MAAVAAPRLSIKKEDEFIPIPVASPRRPERTRAGPSALFKKIARVALLALTVGAVHRAWNNHQARKALQATDFTNELWALDAFAPRHGKPPMIGKEVEDIFLSVPNSASAIAASRQYATKPHLAGSEGDFNTAKYFLELLQHEFSIQPTSSEPIYSAGTPASRNATLSITNLTSPAAWIDTYYPVMNTPLDRKLEIIGDDGEVVWSAKVEEVADSTDPEAGVYAEAVPTFHGLSKNGTAEGQLVYAHYGRREDYAALVEKGVDLKGKIVITRYGGIFRGLKVKGAEELGAAGVLIYSDPRDDGTVTVENGYAPYPNGPARNPTSVQRGSVQYLSMYPGDPTTPGYPAYENSTRTDGANIPKIPSLPMSWNNAKRLLEEIAEGGGNKTIRLVNHVDDRVIPIWNTMGVIPGHIKDEVVLVGNHRDAWVMGATDPSSGTASAHEMIRGFGVLLRKGWKPLRTIVIASWDAEEYGLIGSTEWGEDFADWIQEHVVTYLNLDSSVGGSRYRASASPSLAHLSRQTAEEIPHPTMPGKTLWDATTDSGPFYGENIDEEVKAMYEQDVEAFAASGLGVSPLGSGSDYTVFLQRLGVASGNEGFGSTLSDAVYHYHSVFDSQRWQELYCDPGFTKHVVIAKHLGLQTLRLAGSIVLPLNTTHYAYELESYLDKVEEIVSSSSAEVNLLPLRQSIKALQKASVALDVEKHRAEHALRRAIEKLKKKHAIMRKIRKAICKIRKHIGKPCHKKEDEEAVCDIKSLTPPEFVGKDGRVIKPRLGRAVGIMLERRAEECRAAQRRSEMPLLLAHPSRKLLKAVKRVQAANKKLVAFERGLISDEGIKDREWYKHLGVAPGKWLGYGATTLPALTESITIDNNSTLAKYEAMRLKELIDGLTAKMKS
ncbi:Zn-dependent exopeptidase [Gloeophyllum trabeum ATCC 11539]|uniref:Zn-dependent exopeptidase n=1 Tax=Gloeophyllum trabeum (strain ATCC 11539 / FP-39264 / Madison 617) TaxID=670483 RepID=S7QIL8_GLOTA|nr:Zn-dependent exopeptidase [Gloeophyllum trabeum ATCC 11539]EPQ59132.1 Zn-dependent exopeptidase [Gloeophyllum trabeum ATCC 11539]